MQQDNAIQKRVNGLSYAIFIVFIVLTLKFHLLSIAISGLLIFSLTRRMEQFIQKKHSLSSRAKMLSVMLMSSIASAIFFLIALGIFATIHRQNGLSGIFATAADLLEQLRDRLPIDLQVYLPNGLDELRNLTVTFLKQHAQDISGMGMRGIRSLAGVIIGLVVGIMAAWSMSYRQLRHRPLSFALNQRFMYLLRAFENVVFAQVKISAINTTLTAIFLLVLLPLFDVHLPYAKTLVALTFLVGLLPVIGNLISNTAIMAISATVSLQLVLVSLLFLVVIHKLEYFINAEIIGTRINAKAWEILLSMIVMETLFGAAGVVAAPIVYAYLKNELNALNLIGHETVVLDEI